MERVVWYVTVWNRTVAKIAPRPSDVQTLIYCFLLNTHTERLEHLAWPTGVHNRMVEGQVTLLKFDFRVCFILRCGVGVSGDNDNYMKYVQIPKQCLQGVSNGHCEFRPLSGLRRCGQREGQ